MKRHRVFATIATCGLFSACLAMAAAADAPPVAAANSSRATPELRPDIPRRVFWGDTHLHTDNSLDAGALFGCRLGPEDAYRFARGEEVVSSTGVAAKLDRPYDFLVVSDHSDYMGVFEALSKGTPELLEDSTGREWWEAFHRDGDSGIRFLTQAFVRSLSTGQKLVNSPALARSAWERNVKAADSYNEPGRFTAFIGYEWSSTPAGDNLHRNVIFRDGGDRALHVLPLTAFETQDPEKLWRWMVDYETKTGGEVLAIPHNSNLSGGMMFADRTFGGKPFDLSYAEERSRREPLVEVTQTKGDSETHPTLSPEDDFAGFERWDRTNLFGSKPVSPNQLPYSYIRPTLTRGLAYEQSLGVNPFKFGLVGGTDSHNGLSTVAADNYFGNRPASEPGPGRINPAREPRPAKTWEILSSGLTGIWAKRNTREAMFDALRRREVYATTGPRITVRVFAGWNFRADDLNRSDFAENGYAHGVPMGGDLAGAQPGQSPMLLIQAAKDPEGANLDRVQVIKGWLDGAGGTHESVIDVAWSGSRLPDHDGRLPDVGNTVDVERATYRNTIGAPVLSVGWRDPHFDPAERAYYYIRVLEIPTPRWSTYDAARYGRPRPPGVPAILAQRAYTSPIWYAPNPRS